MAIVCVGDMVRVISTKYDNPTLKQSGMIGTVRLVYPTGNKGFDIEVHFDVGRLSYCYEDVELEEAKHHPMDVDVSLDEIHAFQDLVDR